MSGQLVSMIEPIREKHARAYSAWVEQMAQAFPDGAPEHVFQIRSQTNLARKVYRVDYAISLTDKPEFREFRLDSMVGFTPVSGLVDDIHVALSPFRWDGAVVELEGAVWDVDKVMGWFNHWFGFRGELPLPSRGDRTGGWIHACAKVGEALHVDFGSAPASAFGELIALAGRTGASRVVIRDANYVPADGIPGAPQ